MVLAFFFFLIKECTVGPFFFWLVFFVVFMIRKCHVVKFFSFFFD